LSQTAAQPRAFLVLPVFPTPPRSLDRDGSSRPPAGQETHEASLSAFVSGRLRLQQPWPHPFHAAAARVPCRSFENQNQRKVPWCRRNHETRKMHRITSHANVYSQTRTSDSEHTEKPSPPHDKEYEQKVQNGTSMTWLWAWRSKEDVGTTSGEGGG
jgi:hypothetical protein